MRQFGKSLSDIQVTGAASPVVVSLCPSANIALKRVVAPLSSVVYVLHLTRHRYRLHFPDGQSSTSFTCGSQIRPTFATGSGSFISNPERA